MREGGWGLELYARALPHWGGGLILGMGKAYSGPEGGTNLFIMQYAYGCNDYKHGFSFVRFKGGNHRLQAVSF